jgi:hypothetical protein
MKVQMKTNERKLLREAIRLIGPDCAHIGYNFEDGMRILYRLAGMNNAADFITKLRNAPSRPITDYMHGKHDCYCDGARYCDTCKQECHCGDKS